MPMMSGMPVVTVVSTSSSSEESLPHKFLNVDAPKAKSSPSKTSTTKTMALLLCLRVILSSHIVHLLSLGIFKKFIGVDNFFKFFLGPRVFFVPIWVVLFGSFLEALSNLILVGLARDAQHFVGIRSFCL